MVRNDLVSSNIINSNFNFTSVVIDYSYGDTALRERRRGPRLALCRTKRVPSLLRLPYDRGFQLRMRSPKSSSLIHSIHCLAYLVIQIHVGCGPSNRTKRLPSPSASVSMHAFVSISKTRRPTIISTQSSYTRQERPATPRPRNLLQTNPSNPKSLLCGGARLSQTESRQTVLSSSFYSSVWRL